MYVQRTTGIKHGAGRTENILQIKVNTTLSHFCPVFPCIPEALRTYAFLDIYWFKHLLYYYKYITNDCRYLFCAIFYVIYDFGPKIVEVVIYLYVSILRNNLWFDDLWWYCLIQVFHLFNSNSNSIMKWKIPFFWSMFCMPLRTNDTIPKENRFFNLWSRFSINCFHGNRLIKFNGNFIVHTHLMYGFCCTDQESRVYHGCHSVRYTIFHWTWTRTRKWEEKLNRMCNVQWPWIGIYMEHRPITLIKCWLLCVLYIVPFIDHCC